MAKKTRRGRAGSKPKVKRRHNETCPATDPNVIRLYRKVVQTIRTFRPDGKNTLCRGEVNNLEWQLRSLVKPMQRAKSNYTSNQSVDNEWDRTLEIHWDTDGQFYWPVTPTDDCFTLSMKGFTNDFPHVWGTKRYDLMCTVAEDLLSIVAHMAKDNFPKLYINGFYTSPQRGDSPQNKFHSPTLEVVFNAFSEAGYWKTSLVELTIEDFNEYPSCEDFEAKGAYPEKLERVCVVYKCEHTTLPSTILKLASHSSCLKGIFFESGALVPLGIDHIELSPNSFHYLLEIMKRVDTLEMSNMQIFWNGRSDKEIQMIWDAITFCHSFAPKEFDEQMSYIVKYGARRKLYEFFELVNQYRNKVILGQARTLPKSLVPYVLEHCLYKSRTGWRTKRTDVLFYLLRERADWLMTESQK